MKINTNAWNRFRYTLYAPFYDFFACFYNNSRKKSIESLEIKPGDKILIVGAGTGLDLKFLPSGCEIYATDITPTVVRRIARRNKKLNLNLKTIVMDGQALEFTDNTFEKIILHLILAVIPDPVACLKESERVLKPGGQIVVYDKFVPKGKKVSLLRWLLNVFARVLVTDLTRDFESMVKQTKLKVISDKDADFNGNFRLIKLIKM